MSTVEFKEAIQLEQDQLDIEALMATILESEEGDVVVEHRMDDMQLRRYMLAMQKIKEDALKLKEMKAAVVSQWDDMIGKKNVEVEKLEALIKHELEKRKEENNSFKNVQLDIGTISFIPGKPELQMVSKDNLRVDAMMLGKLKDYEKTEFDAAKLMKDLKEEYKKSGVMPEGFKVGIQEVKTKDSMRFTSRMK